MPVTSATVSSNHHKCLLVAVSVENYNEDVEEGLVVYSGRPLWWRWNVVTV